MASWHQLAVPCPTCDKQTTIRSVAVNVFGNLRLETICLTPDCNNHQKMASFVAKFTTSDIIIQSFQMDEAEVLKFN